MKLKITIIMMLSIIIAVASIVTLKQFQKQRGLIFTLFVPELQSAVDDFYSEYLSSNPIVYNYSGNILRIKKLKDYSGYHIKFGITPVVGPHDPVGYDEIEYFVSNSGEITLLRFSHKKNYDIPPKENITVKSPIPTS